MAEISHDLWTLKHFMGKERKEHFNASYLTMNPDRLGLCYSAASAKPA